MQLNNCAFCFSEQGEVFSWGSGVGGKLGQGHLRDRSTPLRVAELKDKKVSKVACHELHSAAVCGKLFTAIHCRLILLIKNVFWKGLGTMETHAHLRPQNTLSQVRTLSVESLVGGQFSTVCTSSTQLMKRHSIFTLLPTNSSSNTFIFRPSLTSLISYCRYG